LAAVGGAGVYELWVLASQPRWVELQLDAKPSADGRSLAITWDAAAPKSVGATHALLGITDGSENRDVPLSQAEVQLGRYLYTPAHPDLGVRLILYGKGPALSGSALRLAPSPSLVHTAAAPVGPAAASSAPGPVAPPPVVPATAAPQPPASPRRPVHEVQPRISAGIRARLRDRVEIPVDVKIDAKGRVTAASTASSADGLRRYLGAEAVKAARQWRFTAARAGTAPTAEKTISFSFAP
jgi:TonB family protein